MEVDETEEILRKRRYYTGAIEDCSDDVYFETFINNNGNRVILAIDGEAKKVLGISIPSSYFFFEDYSEDFLNEIYIKEKDLDDEKLFIYCLDIQENPGLHELNFCKDYLGFSKWRNTELGPALDSLNFFLDLECYRSSDSGYYSLPLSYCYEKKEENTYVFLKINALTRKVTLTIKIGNTTEDFSFLYGEPSCIIYGALEELKNEVLQK